MGEVLRRNGHRICKEKGREIVSLSYIEEDVFLIFVSFKFS